MAGGDVVVSVGLMVLLQRVVRGPRHGALASVAAVDIRGTRQIQIDAVRLAGILLFSQVCLCLGLAMRQIGVRPWRTD